MMLSYLDRRPGHRAMAAARFRQLLRAYEANDLVAVCSANASFCMALHILVGEHLRREPSWDSKARWLDSFSTSRVFRLPPGRVRVYDAMAWGLRSNTAGRLWPEPFEADLHFSDDLMELISYRIRFGDLRTFPDEGVHQGFARTISDIEAGLVDWRFVWDEGTEPMESP